jgi:hypothetical protein
MVLACVLLLPMVGAEPLTAADTSKISATGRKGEKVVLYKDYHALVVGVGDYDKWPKRPQAVKDAREVAEHLEKLGFQVRLVLDPTHKELKAALKEMAYQTGKEVDRAILFYYAGHGETQLLPDKTRMGYLIPRDCPRLSEDSMGFASQAISMKEMEATSWKTTSRHLLMLFDANLSLSFFALLKAVPYDVRESSALPVRQYISAGREKDDLPDTSIFKRALLMGLAGDADMTEDGYITGTELGMYLRETVRHYTRRRQNSQYAVIRNPDLDRGDFVFVSLKARQTQAADERKLREAALREKAEAEAERKRLEESRVRRLEAERKAAEERALKEAAEKKALEEELRRLKAEDKLRRELAEKKALEEKLRREEEEKKRMEEELKKLREERLRKEAEAKRPLEKDEVRKAEVAKPRTDQEATGPYPARTTPRRMAFFPWRVYVHPARFRAARHSKRRIISSSLSNLIEKISRSQMPTALFSVYPNNRTTLIPESLIQPQRLDDVWKRKGSFSDEYVLNEELVFKAGRDLNVDLIVICYLELLASTEYPVEVYLFDMREGKRYQETFTNIQRLHMPDTIGMSPETATAVANYIESHFQSKMGDRSRGGEQRRPIPGANAAETAAIPTGSEEIGRDGAFIAFANGIVKDTNTGLEWMVGPDRDIAWKEARSWSESLTVDGGGWRLPKIEELRTLYLQGRGTRNMTPLLKGSSHFIWSGEKPLFASEAWTFNYDAGEKALTPLTLSSARRVFAVRSKK